MVHTYLNCSNNEFHVAWLCGHPSIIWLLLSPLHFTCYIIIIIIISIFIEENVFSTTASLPYGPLVNTDIDYFRTFFVIIRTFSY